MQHVLDGDGFLLGSKERAILKKFWRQLTKDLQQNNYSVVLIRFLCVKEESPEVIDEWHQISANLAKIAVCFLVKILFHFSKKNGFVICFVIATMKIPQNLRTLFFGSLLQFQPNLIIFRALRYWEQRVCVLSNLRPFHQLSLS